MHARLAPDAALEELLGGNARFVAGTPRHTEHTARREALAAGQHPFAIVLCCSDSRVPPELVFDTGLGDLFVVRIAGNYAESGGIGSMEYAVAHFAPSLLMVLGHSKCGAITATVDAVRSGEAHAPGHIADIVAALTPAAKAALAGTGDPYAKAVAGNVRDNVARLESTPPILAPAVGAHQLRVVGGVYDLSSSRVTLL
ncbi:MAG: carbonic anhydrase [Vulcanimicrobiaceae bacterium]